MEEHYEDCELMFYTLEIVIVIRFRGVRRGLELVVKDSTGIECRQGSRVRVICFWIFEGDLC